MTTGDVNKYCSRNMDREKFERRVSDATHKDLCHCMDALITWEHRRRDEELGPTWKFPLYISAKKIICDEIARRA